MMRAVALCLAGALASGPVLAQGETAAAPRDGAATPRAAQVAQGEDTWIFTETVSPLDYSPVVTASATSDRPDGPMQLSIQCRRGRTDLVIAVAALGGRPEEQRVSYHVDDGPPAALAAGPAAAGTGLVIKDDVVRLLNGLPAKGDLVIDVTGPAGRVQGHYALPALKAVLGRLAGPCRWPTR